MWISAVVVAVSVLGWAATMAVLSLTAGRPAGLGPRGGRLAACPGTPNCVCSNDDGPSAVAPLTFTGDAAAAWARLKAVLAARPRTLVVSEAEGYLHAECASLVFRFVDDAEFLLDAAGGKIHVRSKSRAGRSDLGVNRARVEEIRAAFAGG
ncbi:MAG: DUF1499 domain-containing protein [Gemmataceae bacterium]